MKTNLINPFLHRVSDGGRSADIPVRSNVRLETPPANSGRAAIRKLLRTGMSALLPALLLLTARASGQMVVGGGGGPAPQPRLDCIPQAQRDAVEAAIAANPVTPRGPQPPDAGPAPYPFQPIAGTVWQERFINNFVDLDSSSGIPDWDCTDFTYDGHQ